MPGRMAGRVALVTGGGGGIGLATGRLFAEEGAAVALLDADGDAVTAAAEHIRAAVPGSAPLALVGDVTREDDARRLVEEASTRLGGLDTLVNVAGVRVYVPLAEATGEDWERIIGVNVLGTAHCCKAALPWLRRGGRGSIVNVSSVYGLMGRAGMGSTIPPRRRCSASRGRSRWRRRRTGCGSTRCARAAPSPRTTSGGPPRAACRRPRYAASAPATTCWAAGRSRARSRSRSCSWPATRPRS